MRKVFPNLQTWWRSLAESIGSHHPAQDLNDNDYDAMPSGTSGGAERHRCSHGLEAGEAVTRIRSSFHTALAGIIVALLILLRSVIHGARADSIAVVQSFTSALTVPLNVPFNFVNTCLATATRSWHRQQSPYGASESQ